MGSGAKIGLVVALIVVVVAGFAIVQPGSGDDGPKSQSDNAAKRETPDRAAKRADSPTVEAESAKPPPPEQLTVVGHEAKGGNVKTIEAQKGDTVRFDVTSDVEDSIHLHGYDVEKTVAPGKPAKFRVKTDIEGEFEIESHEAEHVGKEPLLAKLVVRPS